MNERAPRRMLGKSAFQCQRPSRRTANTRNIHHAERVSTECVKIFSRVGLCPLCECRKVGAGARLETLDTLIRKWAFSILRGPPYFPSYEAPLKTRGVFLSEYQFKKKKKLRERNRNTLDKKENQFFRGSDISPILAPLKRGKCHFCDQRVEHVERPQPRNPMDTGRGVAHVGLIEFDDF